MQRFFIPNDFLFTIYPDVDIDIPTIKFVWEKKKYTFINVKPTVLYNGYYGFCLNKKLPDKLLRHIKPVSNIVE